ncbi:MAG: AbrB/MazE/SpoVT family DNA-binding domain-containing protein [Nanoarchaeota archaeon]|nr:AbrB/MazE/SpoVT family DNA-binding domain-containing protein [Nanoarchaeota archaeon]
MKRKIVQHGNSTLTLSLPSKWVKENNIKKGQILDIEPSEKGLLINLNKIKLDSIEITLSDEKEWYIHRILSHLYTYGFDEIKINYTNLDQLSLIRNSLNELSGFEVVESKSNYCKIKSVTSVDTAEFNSTMNRTFWQILSQFDYFIEDIEKKEYLNLNESFEIHRVVVKLINISKRLINKNIIYGRITSKYAYNLLIGLLNISRSITYSYHYAEKNKCGFTKDEIELIKKIRESYYKLISSYQNLDMKNIKLFLDEREATINESLEVLKGKNPVPIHFFLDMFKEFSTISNFVIIMKTDNDNSTKN